MQRKKHYMDKLDEFIKKHEFTKFRLDSEDQKNFDYFSPLRLALAFDNVKTHKFPDTVMFYTGESKIIIDRIKGVSYQYSELLKIGVIKITAHCPVPFPDGYTVVYKIQAQ